MIDQRVKGAEVYAVRVYKSDLTMEYINRQRSVFGFSRWA